MIILAIDPGTTHSGFVLYSPGSPSPIADFGKVPNEEMLGIISGFWFAMPRPKGGIHLAIEMVASYGMPVGREVFETCVWIGRFIETWGTTDDVIRKTRDEIKMHLCHRAAGVSDSVIRQRLIDIFGGRDKAIGGKKCPKCKGKGWFGAGRPVCPTCNGAKWADKPGPLFGIADDAWQALAVAITVAETSGG